MLAIGMITCHRPNVDVHDAIAQLRWGGFDEPLHLFCEPGTPSLRPLPGVIVHRNETRLGVLGNWSHCLAWLLDHTTADHLLVCEDDVAYARGARTAWEKSLSEIDRVGYWSLYTPRRDQGLVGDRQGWVGSNRGRDAWGTQAMCFPRESAEIVLKYGPLHAEDQFHGPTDAIVAQCFVDAGLPCYYHNPSLADHLGRVSSVGHNWYDEHVGLNFNRDFAAVTEDLAALPASSVFVAAPRSQSRPRRTAVVTVFQDNIPAEVVTAQAEVICRFLPAGSEFEPRRVSHHALGLDDYFRDLRHEAYIVFDVDCIPTAEWVMPWLFQNALAGIVVGAAQRANHLENGGHIYAGPCALAFSRKTFERLGKPSFGATPRADVAEELTYSWEQFGIPLSLLWPTHVTVPKWTLRPEIPFGLGTTFGGAVYHAFEISKGQTVDMFLKKCREILAAAGGMADPSAQPDAVPSPPTAQDAPVRQQATFNEQWYAESELEMLIAAVQFVRPLQGAIIEVGCWEGRTTSAIANTCFPEKVMAVDTWQGNLAEGAEHITVQLARERDVFAIFQANMRCLTRGNVVPERVEAMDYLRQLGGAVKFCHVDAAHDYRSVRDTLQALLPKLARGGVLIGHDYETAHSGRDDLQGGVQRAVREVLPHHVSRGNVWWYVHMS
jgi:hypothetical protein